MLLTSCHTLPYSFQHAARDSWTQHRRPASIIPQLPGSREKQPASADRARAKGGPLADEEPGQKALQPALRGQRFHRLLGSCWAALQDRPRGSSRGWQRHPGPAGGSPTGPAVCTLRVHRPPTL